MSKGINQKISELYILTNQMRLELGQVKKLQQPSYLERARLTAKKHFIHSSNPPTDVYSPLEVNSKPIKPQNKKHYNKYHTLHQ